MYQYTFKLLLLSSILNQCTLPLLSGSSSQTISLCPVSMSCWEQHAETKHRMFWNKELFLSSVLLSAASGSAASSSAGLIMKQIYFVSASNVPWSINPVSLLLSCQAGALTLESTKLHWLLSFCRAVCLTGWLPLWWKWRVGGGGWSKTRTGFPLIFFPCAH